MRGAHHAHTQHANAPPNSMGWTGVQAVDMEMQAKAAWQEPHLDLYSRHMQDCSTFFSFSGVRMCAL